MANNVNITAGVGTPIATDEIGGVHYQRVKLAVGGEDSAADVSAQAPMPVGVPVASLVATSSVNATTSATAIAGDSSGARRGLTFYNDSTNYLYLRCNVAPTLSTFQVRIEPFQYYELPAPIWPGIIYGLWSGTNGAVRVTELF